MRRTNHEADTNRDDTVRLTAYITASEKKQWETILDRACEVDGIRNRDNGTFLGRIIRARLALDKDSIAKYQALDRRVVSKS